MSKDEFSFRDLRADEITLKAFPDGSGISIILYKDARVDINILNETVGPKNWTRRYPHNSSYCEVSIWDNEKNLWVTKGDYGQCDFGSNSEKGTASDSFKRACFSWGIGIELYSSPVINIPRHYVTVVNTNNVPRVLDDLYVSEFKVKDHIITDLSITSSLSNQVIYSYVDGKEVKVTPVLSYQNQLKLFVSTIKDLTLMEVAQEYKINGNSSEEDFKNVLEQLKAKYNES